MRGLRAVSHYLPVTVSISLPWIGRRNLPPEDQRRGRLRRVLRSAAAKTRYARQYDLGADRFEQLPKVDLLEFLCHSERYAVENTTPVRERLHYPLGEAPRTAVIARKVEETRRVRSFSGIQAKELAAFAPQSLAAPLDALRTAEAGGAAHAPLRNMIIVFTGILEGPLTAADTGRFWRRYQVPVFEQFLGFDGELLAWECEMHDGLHVREQAAHFEICEEDRLVVSFLANPRLPLLRLETGLCGRLLAEVCTCGDASPRVVDLRRRSVQRISNAAPMAMAAVG